MSELRSDDPVEIQLAEACAEFYADPVGWVRWAFDWGRGDLRGFEGLDVWQEQWLSEVGQAVAERGFNGVDPVMPIRKSTASGHGIGKSALVAILILWIKSTRANSKGVVTANTGDQLRTKTWGELAKWKALCITGHWFEINSGKGSLSIYHKGFPETWRADGVTCREENSEAFAGLHNSASTPYYIFDEASAVPDAIWEVAEGGLTDGEPMFFAFGNPTRAGGAFRRTFMDSRWDSKQIDSRTASRTNKQLIQEWLDTYGEDSDFFRVRVKGQFPRASDAQFFPTDVVSAAMKRPLPPGQLTNEPLICGIDYCRGGSDKMVVQFRRGRDARSHVRYEMAGEKTRDSMKVAAVLSSILNRHRPDVTFGDVGSMGGPINDRLRQLGHNVIDVGFGHNAEDGKKYADRTSEMSARLLEWLYAEGCLPDLSELETALTEREFSHDKDDRLLMESKKQMKKRLGWSPDDMDAMLLTFASEVAAELDEYEDFGEYARTGHWEGRSEVTPYNPFDRTR